MNRPPTRESTRQPTMSVVVPTRNRAVRVRTCVEAVLADPAATEVVVVDDGSDDETPQVLKAIASADARVRIVRTDGEGPSRARQRGLDAASGDLVLMLDDDVVPRPGLVGGHRTRHVAVGDPALVLVGYMPTRVPHRRAPGQFATRLYAAEYEARVASWEQGHSDILEHLWLGNVSAARDVWRAVGMDDPDYRSPSHEDQDLGVRMRNQGMWASFDRALLADHLHERTLDQFLRDSYHQGLGRCHLARRHGMTTAEQAALGADLLPPLRRFVGATDRPAVRTALCGTMRVVVGAGGRLHVWPVEDAAARVLRRVELRRGAQEAAAP